MVGIEKCRKVEAGAQLCREWEADARQCRQRGIGRGRGVSM